MPTIKHYDPSRGLTKLHLEKGMQNAERIKLKMQISNPYFKLKSTKARRNYDLSQSSISQPQILIYLVFLITILSISEIKTASSHDFDTFYANNKNRPASFAASLLTIEDYLARRDEILTDRRQDDSLDEKLMNLDRMPPISNEEPFEAMRLVQTSVDEGLSDFSEPSALWEPHKRRHDESLDGRFGVETRSDHQAPEDIYPPVLDARSSSISNEPQNEQTLYADDHVTTELLRTQQETPTQSSQELSPITIGLDPNNPYAPFSVGLRGASSLGQAPLPPQPPPPPPPPPPQIARKPQLSNSNNAFNSPVPFGFAPLPQLMGFRTNDGGAPDFNGAPQLGDQSAPLAHRSPATLMDHEMQPQEEHKVWPKIFRFTDGRINLGDFEKQKKVKLSNKNMNGAESYMDSAPIMFDGRPLKRKSFLILHGGIF